MDSRHEAQLTKGCLRLCTQDNLNSDIFWHSKICSLSSTDRVNSRHPSRTTGFWGTQNCLTFLAFAAGQESQILHVLLLGGNTYPGQSTHLPFSLAAGELQAWSGQQAKPSHIQYQGTVEAEKCWGWGKQALWPALQPSCRSTRLQLLPWLRA